MRQAASLIALTALLMPVPALGQTAAPASAAPSERRLPPDQIEAVLAEAAKKREAAERSLGPEAIEAPVKPQVHGEVGVAVGTGGYREVFGTAITPIGEDGAAAISLDFVDWSRRRFKR